MKVRTLVFVAAMTALPSYVLAQGAHGGHSGHSTPAQTAQTPETPATKGYRQANEAMHRNMDIPFSGDADVDFVRSMIPHHQGAIAMADVVLRYGKDEQTRRWAADVINAQKREIAEMQDWLRTHGR